jgi:hypothetical protein
MTREPIQMHRGSALPCPFCGEQPVIQPWHGGPKTKRLIGCDNDDCAVRPAVAENTRTRALRTWNTRRGQ